jgi:hypothetical protein
VLRCAVYKTSVRGINIPGGVPDYTEGVGGFVGQNTGVINDCYSWADVVNDNYYIGGFAGSDETGMIERCYSTGFLLSMWTYGFSAPGLVYLCDFNSFELCPGCFWDIETTGASESYGGTGLTTEQMHSMDNFVNAGWDFENTWRMCDGFNYPHLQWEERIAGDITCPDGVGMEDFYQLAAQWQMTKLSGDFLPDGIVNLDDWCMLTSAWNSELGEADYDPGCDISGEIADGAINIDDLTVFIGQWLSEGLYSADVCPEQGDDVVNNDDLAVISENWLQGR